MSQNEIVRSTINLLLDIARGDEVNVSDVNQSIADLETILQKPSGGDPLIYKFEDYVDLKPRGNGPRAA